MTERGNTQVYNNSFRPGLHCQNGLKTKLKICTEIEDLNNTINLSRFNRHIQNTTKNKHTNKNSYTFF